MWLHLQSLWTSLVQLPEQLLQTGNPGSEEAADSPLDGPCRLKGLLSAHPLTLRFVEPELEAEFVQHRLGDLASRLYMASAAILAFCGVLLCERHITPPVSATDRKTSVLQELQWCQTAALGTAAASSALIMGLAKAQRYIDLLQPLVCEIGAVFAIVAATILVFYTEPYYMAKLHGHEPLAVFGSSVLEAKIPFADTRLLLAVDSIVTLSHLLPIRSCVVWPVACTGIAAYAVMIMFVGSPERGRAPGNLLLLTTLSFSALVGKRNLECYERHAFGSRTPAMSFQAEIQLNDLSTSGHAETGAVRLIQDDECSVPSVPTTTYTGRMFAELERVDSEVRWKLERIADIGHRERWLIEASQVRLMPQNILGSGSFGVVVLASLHGSQVAVKVPKSSHHGSTAWHLPSLGNELRILRHVRHPNVVLFHGACIDPTSSELALVLEYVQGHRLDRFVEVPHKIAPSNQARHLILIDICCALRYLHAQRPCIVHGDLKASNILVEDRHEHPRPKLVDFGLSRLLTRKAKPLGGTLNWMAPELMKNPGMSPAPSADVFSFGRLAYFVTTGVRPLANIDRRTFVKLARKARIPPLHWPEEAPFLDPCRTLVQHCLEVDAAVRPHMVAVHHDLVLWQPSKRYELETTAGKNASCTGGGEGDPESPGESSMSWRSGLRMVRESLRPIPPNRQGVPEAEALAQACEAVSKWTSSEPIGIESGVESDSVNQCKPLRRERPRPPPRPQPPQATPRPRPALPTLPPVLEGEGDLTNSGATPKASDGRRDGGSQFLGGEGLDTMLLGLPAVAEGESEDQGVGAGTSASSEATSLVIPHFRETPQAMMEISAIDAMQRWNFNRSEGSCCVWHSALDWLRKVQLSLRGHPCSIDFQIVRDWQCPRCLLTDQLDPDMDPECKDCDLCGYDPADSRSVAGPGAEVKENK